MRVAFEAYCAPILIITQIALFILESAVAIIQSYNYGEKYNVYN